MALNQNAKINEFVVGLLNVGIAVFFTLLLAACGDDTSSEPVAAVAVERPSSIYWAGSFAGPEEIYNPAYLWVYYNTTDGCSYIYTYSGWTLFASGAKNVNNESYATTIDGRDGIDGKNGADGRDGINGKDGLNGANGKDGVDGKDGKDGIDGKNGIDGRDGIDGKDGKDGVDGKDGKDGIDGKNGIDGRDGVDGKDGEDGFVFVRSTEEISDGVAYDVKSYAQLEAGNPYFYMYYKC